MHWTRDHHPSPSRREIRVLRPIYGSTPDTSSSCSRRTVTIQSVTTLHGERGVNVSLQSDMPRRCGIKCVCIVCLCVYLAPLAPFSPAPSLVLCRTKASLAFVYSYLPAVCPFQFVTFQFSVSVLSVFSLLGAAITAAAATITTTIIPPPSAITTTITTATTATTTAVDNNDNSIYNNDNQNNN